MRSVEDIEHLLVQLVEAEKVDTCGPGSMHNYLDIHRQRFSDILQICQRHVPNRSAKVMDVGRSALTTQLCEFYQNVHTLGLDLSLDDGGHRELIRMDGVPHITFDLLNSPIRSAWPDCGAFDLIVFSEVIEHLSVAPEFVLAVLSSMLTERGVIICSTPNASDLAKRIRLAFGRNPYERLRLYSTNPGHIREYTRQELYQIASSVGLTCTSHAYYSWDTRSGRSQLKTAIMSVLRAYPPFRPFQMCVLVKENTEAGCLF